jgi:hypothetical protein
MNGYNVYLMIQLAHEVGVLARDLEYDILWSAGEQLYKEFEDSSYFEDDFPEYECILNFLSTKQPISAEQI